MRTWGVWLRRRLGSGQRGAAATLVAVLLGSGTLLGFGAVTIDVGHLMWERRELQNGADAAALDLARICGTKPTACTTSDTTTRADLQELIDANAKDEAGTLTSYCLGGPAVAGASLPVCAPGDNAQLTNCPALPTAYATGFPYVQVHTSTKTSDGGTILPYAVAQTLTGTSGSSVGACARATWGAPASATAKTPITISECEWNTLTADGLTYAEPPVYNGSTSHGYGGAGQPALPPASQRVVLQLKTVVEATECPSWGPGIDMPGGFGYLSNEDCKSEVTPPGWIKVDNGGDFPCDKVMFANLLGTVVDVPVYACMEKDGTSPPTWNPILDPVKAQAECDDKIGGNWSYYFIRGWAKFYISGWHFTSGPPDAAVPGTTYGCKGGNLCLSGWFTSGVLQADEVVAPDPGGNVFGSIGVVPAG
ncbi:pilus assembly protein TadG-related protein [Janibacter sp. G56]|uniref:pilus assembly protein TadG-related protein n=1 Tax=Janibacter sp. G56 TaxID=3418717 RepID=UPI003CFE7B05